MIEAAVCSADFLSFLASTIYPLAAYAGVVAGIIIAATFMIGEATRNPKLTVWSKTEVLQLFISIISLVLLSSVLGLFCTLDVTGVADLFGLTVSYSGPYTIFDGAENYLMGAAVYSHNALTVIRYHLEGFTVLGYMGEFECDMATGPIGWGCWFGYSGTSGQPFGGYAAMVAALNTIFNATMMSYLVSLNYLMILLYVYRGFAFFLFPIGIFLRSMPYLRSFGSLLISLAISFIIVYPFFLGVFDIMADNALFNRSSSTPYLPDPSLAEFLNEDTYPDHSAGVGASLASAFDPDFVKDMYFPHGNKSAEAIAFGGMAFVAGFFFPSIALLAAIAATVYLARLYGEEVDLSRLMQMV